MAKMIGKTHKVGWGGRQCICCYHPPTWRKSENRRAKRSERQKWRKEV